MIVACIPAFEEEKTIAGVILKALPHVDEVVVCDDGSTDLTGAIAERMGATVLTHDQNMGKGAALRTLFNKGRELGADILVTIDGDGQHDPDEIPLLVDIIKSGSADIAVGSRFLESNGSVPKYREVGNKLLNALVSDTVSDTQSGFRAYGKSAIASISPGEMGMGADSEILMEAAHRGMKIVEVPISVKYGEGKTSTHNPFYHTLDVIFSVVKLTSIKHPLAFYGAGGLVSLLFGVYFATRVIGLYLVSKTVDSITITYGLLAFAFLMAGLLTFFTGILLFTITTVVRRASR
jgi:glycosyltransferase involved in cell wall biosynthesis